MILSKKKKNVENCGEKCTNTQEQYLGREIGDMDTYKMVTRNIHDSEWGKKN